MLQSSRTVPGGPYRYLRASSAYLPPARQPPSCCICLRPIFCSAGRELTVRKSALTCCRTFALGRKLGASPGAGVKILLQYPATADIRLMTSLPCRCFRVFLTPFRGNPDGHGKVPLRPYRPNKVDQGTRRYTNASTRLTVTFRAGLHWGPFDSTGDPNAIRSTRPG